jgi:pyruvate/2-oxoglutarate dehydrogenase complex dihydrolipoamide dehydrogenase (E3) component
LEFGRAWDTVAHMKSYEFVVIGGGSAGYAGARTALDLGLKTAVIDGAETLGGLCILKGCMPSKTLIESANRFRVMREANEFGLRAENLAVKPEEIIARKRRLIGEFAEYRQEQLETKPFDLIRGKARFLDANRLEVSLRDGGTEEIHAETILIATGSTISTVSVPGLDEISYLTSDDVLDRPTLPTSIIVLGGGAIALELAHYYNGLGVEVTVIQRSPQLLKSADKDVADTLQVALESHGMTIFTGTQLLDAEMKDGQRCVRFRYNGEVQECLAEEILMATGRFPNTATLDLKTAKVLTNRRGGIDVTAQQASSQPHIFAAGDVGSPIEVVHIAITQGENAAHNAALHLGKLPGKSPKTTDYRLKLFGIFTEPEIGMVGMTEAEAEAAGIPFEVATYPFEDHGKSIVSGALHGFVKLIAHKDDGRLLGGAVIGPHAVELIHEITVAMYFNATARQLAEIPHYHPTLSEIWTYPAEDLAESCHTN